MINICFLLGTFSKNGGIGRVTAILANNLAQKKDYNVYTLSYLKTDLPNLYGISDNVHECYFLEAYQSMSKVIISGGVKRLKRFLQKNKIDILVACGALFFPISVLACKKIKTKCICWEHSNPEGNSDHRMQNISRKFGICRADANVVLTKSAFDIYEMRYKAKHLFQIYNPIDHSLLNQKTSYDVESKAIITVGRLSYQKNIELAIEIANVILKKHPDWKWYVYGEGDMREELEKKIKKYNLEDRFILKGQINNLYKKYQEFSFMVMTSRYEGFPMTLLEGMGSGLPLIAFNVPTGPNEIIIDHKNGYLIEPFDMKDMIKKIELLINNPGIRINMANINKDMCHKFSEDEFVRQWMKTIEYLV